MHGQVPAPAAVTSSVDVYGHTVQILDQDKRTLPRDVACTAYSARSTRMLACMRTHCHAHTHVHTHTHTGKDLIICMRLKVHRTSTSSRCRPQYQRSPQPWIVLGILSLEARVTLVASRFPTRCRECESTRMRSRGADGEPVVCRIVQLGK
jgi:hypothetical protein